MNLNEQTLLEQSKRINKIKNAVKKVNKRKTAKLLERKRDLEHQNTLKELMGDEVVK